MDKSFFNEKEPEKTEERREKRAVDKFAFLGGQRRGKNVEMWKRLEKSLKK